jgi:flagellar hook-length control protein FliK
MDQIRFDFLGNVNGGNGRNNSANANGAESGDAFAQILDQQLTRRADAGTGRRAAEPRSRKDAGDGADGPRPQVLKRRDPKSAATATASAKTEAKPAPKPKQPEKSATETDSCAKPTTKPQPDEADETTEAPACGQTATESKTSENTTDAEANPDTPDESSQQQPDDGSQQPASDGTDETIAAEADLSLLATLAVPLPLQTVTADVDASAETTVLSGGGNAATAMQASLAASLAGAIDLGAAVGGKAQTDAKSGGLTFGAILNAGLAVPPKTATDPVAALQDTAAELAQAADPLAQPVPGTKGEKPSDAIATPPAKAREATKDNVATALNPEQNAKANAALVQPMNRAQGVTWSGTNMRNELSESMAAQAGVSFAADDTEFSNWSQFLGAGAGGLGNTLSARQSAFMAQLKQNLQILPPHEQIAVQIRDAMQNGNSRLTVALHPVELGRVEVKLEIDKDKNVTATVLVDRPATLDLLRNDAKALERALQDAGLQTGSGSLSFNLRDSSGQDGGSAQNGTGTGGGSGAGNGAGGSEVKAEIRADVVATADGYVDLET